MPYNPLNLSGRVAVVTGGTSGIGRIIALALAEGGADVVATSRRQDRVDAVAGEIEQRGRQTLRVASDVTNRESLNALLDSCLSSLQRVDVLVNCAGQIARVPTLELTESAWQQTLDTNLTGTLRACQVFGPHMIARGDGRIVNIASLSSFVALREVTAYAVSKAGLVALTKQLAIEWAHSGVCVNAIAPGVFRTPLNEKLLDGTPRGQEFLLRTPMRRFGKIEELGGAAVFLASPAASFVTGQVLVVDGGFLASGVNQ
jgi:NAD(P)-dependent dehydrogenase (short-subunit alcohol dehydrogenase family)